MARGRERKPMLVGGAIALTAALASWGREPPRARSAVVEPVGVVGSVSHPHAVTVEVCGTPALVGADGGFAAGAEAGTPCRVVARRHFGVFQWQTSVTVMPGVGEVHLKTPAVDGVLPLVVERVDHGFRVAQDWSDAGLDGLVFVACDGVPVGDEPVLWQLALGGPAGLLRRCVTDDGRVHELRLHALGFADWLHHQG